MKGTVRQRSPGSWELQIFLGRDSNGKRLRKTETVRGKKADAERRLRELLTNLDHGIAPPKRAYKLEEWLHQWMMDVIVPRRRQKTVDRYLNQSQGGMCIWLVMRTGMGVSQELLCP